MSDDADRFFFVHVQKTAGTSFIRRARRHFAEGEVYPSKDDGDIVECVISVDHLLSRWQARRDEIRLVTGHFPLCTAELLDGGFTTLTLLREPVERTLSYLRHHRKLTPEDRHLSLEQVYDDPLRFHGLAHNHMVKMLSLEVPEMDAGALTRVEFTRARLEHAQERLETVDVVGLQEDFERFCDEVTDRFGWRLGEPLHSNRTTPEDVDEAFVERIVEDNALDIELYEFARRLVRSRYAGAVHH